MPKPATPQFEYKHFTDPAHREAMKEAVVNVMTYAKQRGVKTVLLTGCNATVAGILFKEAWPRLHSEPLPQIIPLEGSFTKVTGGCPEGDLYNERKVPAMLSEVRRRILKKQSNFPNGPVLLLGANVTGGNTLSWAREFAEQLLETKFPNKPASVYTAALLQSSDVAFTGVGAIGKVWARFSRPHIIGRHEMFEGFNKLPRQEQENRRRKMKQISEELKHLASEIPPRR